IISRRASTSRSASRPEHRAPTPAPAMSAILAKKLGMTQVFQPDGSVARVTVLQAGPCPVTAIRTLERDGYEAVQLAFGASREKQLSKPELGHLKKAGASPMRRLAEFRDEVGELTLGEAVFGERFRGSLVHQSVRAEQAARRRGTAATKSRGLVSGGGAKPWRQKGTGRARAGSSRSPIWTGVGTVFGPKPRSYTFKVNRKERRAALRSALSVHADRGSLAILDPAPFADAPSAKQAAAL